MLEIKNTTKKNIFKENNLHKISFLGVAKRETLNPFGKKYDLKVENKLYFKAFNSFYIFTEKKEYRDGVLVRVRQSDEITQDIKIFKNKEKDNFKTITTKYLIPKDTNFNLFKINNIFIAGARKEAIAYGNDYMFFIKDDGWDNEKEYGLCIKENNLIETNKERLENSFV